MILLEYEPERERPMTRIIPKSTNCRRPVTSITERMDELQLIARWWGREGRL